MKRREFISFPAVILLLLVSHATLNTYIPVFSLNLVAIAFTTLLSVIYARRLRDEYQVTLLFYILSHFVFGNYQGGLQNLVFFFVILFSGKVNIATMFGHPMILPVIVILISHLLGVVFKSVAPILDTLLGTISLVSYLSVFFIVSSIKLNKKQFGTFLKVSAMLTFIMLLSQINSRYAFLVSKSPIVGYSSVHNVAGHFFRSMMGSSPITAEFAFMNLVLGIGVAASVKDINTFGLKRLSLVFLIVVAASVMLLTANRSTVFLSIAAIAILSLINLPRFSSRSIQTVLLVLFILAFVFSFRSQLGVDYLGQRLLEIDYEKVDIESIESGDSINRGAAFVLGSQMLRRENWLIGYGWSTYNYNRVAWFGTTEIIREDPHSLYYALPMLFGWIGSVAFLIIVVSPILASLRKKNTVIIRNKDDREISRIFILINLLFMINEVKQGFVVSPNYFFIIMFWTGIAFSVNRYGLLED